MVILPYPLLVELHRTFIRKVLPRQKSSLGQSSREKRAEQGGGGGVERISIYTLRSEEQPSWALLLKLLIINRGDKMKARLISLARRKYSLSICWLLNRLWLVSLSPRMGRETSLWPRQTSSSA